MKLKNRNNKGNAAIEFAIVLPLFLLIVMGIIEFSIILYDKAVITNASRVGARTGILFDVDIEPEVTITTAVEGKVGAYLQDFLISLGGDSGYSVGVVENFPISGDVGVKVTVTYPYQFLVVPNLSKFFGPGIADALTLTAETVMRKEEQPPPT